VAPPGQGHFPAQKDVDLCAGQFTREFAPAQGSSGAQVAQVLVFLVLAAGNSSFFSEIVLDSLFFKHREPPFDAVAGAVAAKEHAVFTILATIEALYHIVQLVLRRLLQGAIQRQSDF
jgi:hypothetical protein